ncbi:MAG: IMP dehydrogenase [Pseudomonadota bacterium]
MSDDIHLAYSFDDVLLVPQESAIVPAEADLDTRLTENIALKIPIVSSAMDTVTEDELAIALAREGGLGVIHRNCTVSEQADMVARVKRSENMIIPDPFTVTREISIETLQNIMDERGVAGFPVIDGEGKLEGMVTTRDIWWIESPSTTTVADVMTPRDRLTTGRANTTMEEAREVLFNDRI